MNTSKRLSSKNRSAGFSLLELIIALTITLVIMAAATTLFSAALRTRDRENQRTDALSSAQSALNIMSREIANSGFALTDNGIVTTDSSETRLHFRANIQNSDSTTDDPGEDVIYFYDAGSESIIRYDRFNTPQASTVISQASDLTFQYFDYAGSSSTPTVNSSPTANTGRVRITIRIHLDPVAGEPNEQTISYTSDVALRNSSYILKQY